jgi:hypothetical protein
MWGLERAMPQSKALVAICTCRIHEKRKTHLLKQFPFDLEQCAGGSNLRTQSLSDWA